MADDIIGSEAGQVENQSYAMKKSFNARNVDSMSEMMGYKDLSDLANCPKGETKVSAKSANSQNGPKGADARMNDRKGSAY